MTIWLTFDRFRDVCFDLAVQATWVAQEPIPSFDTRYPNRLESCLDTPRQTFGGLALYPTLVDQATILFYLLIKNHPFMNGNKRIALTALLVFLFLNGKWLSVQQEELYQFIVNVAGSDARDKDRVIAGIKDFIAAHLSKLGDIK